MAFSYDVLHLNDNPKDQVRFKLGDTVEDTAFFQDEEITFALSQCNQNVLEACIICVEAILPRIANHSAGFKVGPYEEKNLSGSTYQYWSKLLSDLRKEHSAGAAPMMVEAGPSIFRYDMLGHYDHGTTHT